MADVTVEKPGAEPAIDPEAQLLFTCMDAFARAGTDRWGDQRVLEHLAQRFGPAAYEDEEEPETPE